MRLTLGEIRLDGGTQPRASLDAECVARYEREMRDGVQYDPIEVVYDGANYWCWDGFHRCSAAGRAGLKEIEAHVTQGTLEEAQWLSVGANKRHGLPRSNPDKIRAVRTALQHPKGRGLSDGAIAEHVGVSQPFVGKVRRKLATTHNAFESPARTGRDGRTINTARIGKPKRCKAHKPRSPAEFREARENGFRGPVPSMVKLELPNNHIRNCAYDLLEYFTFEYLQKVFQEVIAIHQERLQKQKENPR